MNLKFFLAAFTFLTFLFIATAQKPLLCYYASWAYYRPGRGQYRVENIDPWLCTHLMYASFGMDEDASIVFNNPALDIDMGNIRQFNELKNVNANLKTFAVIAGLSAGSVTFSRVAASPNLRQRFAESARNFCLEHGFDGVDINWEYPGRYGGDPDNDKANFVLMLADLREVLSASDLMLTASVGAAQHHVDTSYDVPAISQYLDYINLMTYDYNGAWDAYTGHNAPLYSGPSETTNFQRTLNVNHSVMYWLSEGAPSNKLILGIPFYGRTFTLQNPDNYWLRDTATGPGRPGSFTGVAGALSYFEICPFVTRIWDRHWEDNQKAAFGVNGDQWVGYDDVESVLIKCSYVDEHGLAGIMVWTMDRDDFRGYCGSNNPMLSTIRECFRST
ncbi:acidic mammalian chitinase-like [Wyeomyia smithii]|uniref:acidic mammalian chitinase-like n=1 Tax=Wyeomyia smithii TaxID=174621 RepID=UPI002467ADD9|nr:acidic mammalian chitinase-like [Wyeomyia smithii]